MLWDLSSYDFADFRKGQWQWSTGFQLLSSGVTAWLELFPKGNAKSSNGQAALFLWVNKPAVVKWSCQSGSGAVSTGEWDFSNASSDPDGTPDGWGWLDFMPISEANGSITLRILSVQVPGSKLRFN